MSKELTISNLDQHLKPLQIDGVTTPIELSTEAIRMNKEISLQQDLFISGDIHCTGKYDGLNLDHGMKIYSSASVNGGINIAAAYLSLYANTWTGDGDEEDNNATLVLVASDGYDSQINLMEASSTRWTIGNDADDSDSLKFDAGNPVVGGATKLTLDSSGNLTAAGDVIAGDDVAVPSTGKISLDGIGGHTYIVEDADDRLEFFVGTDKMLVLDEANDRIIIGASNWRACTVSGDTLTEFSAAESAYAGMILGYTLIGNDVADDSYTLTTSYVCFQDSGGTAISVTFKTPPSENVEIEVSLYFSAGSGASDLELSLSNNATYGSNSLHHSLQHERVVCTPARGNGGTVTQKFYLNEYHLEAVGASNTIFIAAGASSTSGTPSIKWGGDASGDPTNLVMKATALPATLGTGS